MVVKRIKESNRIKNLTEVFTILKRYKLRLNVTKCAFGVSSGKFLGHLVKIRGIKANSEQIIAINNLDSPRTTKEVQKLTGMAEALNRFINKSSNKCRLFFKLLRKNTKFLWNEECDLHSNNSRNTWLNRCFFLHRMRESCSMFTLLSLNMPLARYF